MKKQLFFKAIEPSWRLFWKNKRLMPLAVLADLLFFSGLVLLNMKIFSTISMKLQMLMSVMGQAFETEAPDKFIAQTQAVMQQYMQERFVLFYPCQT